MRSIRQPTAVLIGVLALAGAGRADEPPASEATSAACDVERAEAVARRVQARYDAIADLRADFVQSTESVVMSAGPGAATEASRGRVLFSKPGRMRWTYVEPKESLVVSDGSVLWLHEKGSGQATRLPVSREYLAGAALQFLLGEGDLLAAFEVSPVSCGAQSVELKLRPREPASYERLGLTADAETGLVTATSIVDVFGNRTRIEFENVTLDVEPPPGSFDFAPPEGVEVIDLRESG